MIQGHLDQTRPHSNSTRQPTSQPGLALAENSGELVTKAVDIQEPAPPCTRALYAECYQISGQIYTNQVGRLLTLSRAGNEYILLTYDYDSNYIHVEPMKSRSASEHMKAYQRTITLLKQQGLQSQLHRLDNEASTLLRDFITGEQIVYQLTPPNVKRSNTSEREL
jgi:hypothetical protein